MVWAFLIVVPGVLAQVASLAEMASAQPIAGAQYVRGTTWVKSRMLTLASSIGHGITPPRIAAGVSLGYRAG